eukprot:TRINITY_DN20872_c0_g1_i1.p1 TRINITY_DN20872_c0_g1~~TRINITY_DN20872_c0_g1_i1.p1  ORF type:complete len:787 (+),score=126.97 TRINITY_DN20872_c0_g1_i1:190-2550(+)
MSASGVGSLAAAASAAVRPSQRQAIAEPFPFAWETKARDVGGAKSQALSRHNQHAAAAHSAAPQPAAAYPCGPPSTVPNLASSQTAEAVAVQGRPRASSVRAQAAAGSPQRTPLRTQGESAVPEPAVRRANSARRMPAGPPKQHMARPRTARDEVPRCPVPQIPASDGNEGATNASDEVSPTEAVCTRQRAVHGSPRRHASQEAVGDAPSVAWPPPRDLSEKRCKAAQSSPRRPVPFALGDVVTEAPTGARARAVVGSPMRRVETSPPIAPGFAQRDSPRNRYRDVLQIFPAAERNPSPIPSSPAGSGGSGAGTNGLLAPPRRLGVGRCPLPLSADAGCDEGTADAGSDLTSSQADGRGGRLSRANSAGLLGVEPSRNAGDPVSPRPNQLRAEIVAPQASRCGLGACPVCSAGASVASSPNEKSTNASVSNSPQAPSNSSLGSSSAASPIQTLKPTGRQQRNAHPSGQSSRARDAPGRRTTGTGPALGRKLPQTSPAVREPAEGEASKPLGPANSGEPLAGLDAYALGKVLGRGAFGKVNVGVHRQTGEQVAIKFCDKRTASQATQNRQCLTEEVRVMKRLTGHPGLLQVYEMIETRDQIVIILELCAGGDVQKLVKRRRLLVEECGQRLMKQLLSALQHMHSVCVAHRDIKLENLLLCDLGNLKIADFGVAAFVDPPTKQFRDTCGTPSYMAPEVLCKAGYEAWPADMWSAGVTLHAMLCGAVPFKGENVEELKKRVIQGIGRPPTHLSQNAASLMCGLLELEPAQRLSAAAALEHRWFQEYSTG